MKDFDETITKIEAAVDKEIADGKRKPEDRERRVEYSIKKLDDKFPGLEEHWRKKSKPKKGNTKPKVVKATVKKSGKKIPEVAMNFFNEWIGKYPQLKMPALQKSWHECYDALDFIEDGEMRINESLLELQGEFSQIVNRPTGEYEFTPIVVKSHSTFEKKEFREVPGKEYKDEVLVTYHRASVYGIFHNIETKVESFGSLIAWDEDTAIAISKVEPYYNYKGSLEGYLKSGVYVLNINEVQKFEATSKSDEDTIHKKAVKYIQTSEAKVYTVGQMETYKAGVKTENLIVKGKIREIRKQKIGKDGRAMGGLALSSSEPGSLGEVNISWFDGAEITTKYGQKSTVYVGLSVSKKKDNTYFNGDWVIPIMARPGVKNIAPAQIED